MQEKLLKSRDGRCSSWTSHSIQQTSLCSHQRWACLHLRWVSVHNVKFILWNCKWQRGTGNNQSINRERTCFHNRKLPGCRDFPSYSECSGSERSSCEHPSWPCPAWFIHNNQHCCDVDRCWGPGMSQRANMCHCHLHTRDRRAPLAFWFLLFASWALIHSTWY